MYTPINADVYSIAIAAAAAGMANAGRVSQDAVASDYDSINADAGAWAQEFDIAWGSATTITEPQALLINSQSYGFWSGRVASGSLATTPATWAPYIAMMIAVITSNDNYLTGQGITPPTWGGGGGGGGGGGVPNTPANSVGFLLTSTNNTGGSLPASTSSDWEPSGGFVITSFAKNHGASFEVGNTDVQPSFTASYSELPDSAHITYTQQPGSPLVLLTPFTAGQILQTFTSNVNGATATFTLSAVKGATTKTSTLTDTWGLPFLSIIDLVGNVVATQGYLDTMRAANPVQVRTTEGGTYLAGQNVAAGRISAIALPTALDSGAPWTDNESGLPVTPNFIGTVAGYTNPFGVVVSMNLYTVGGIGVGTVSWSLP